jgi:hypothetical protein
MIEWIIPSIFAFMAVWIYIPRTVFLFRSGFRFYFDSNPNASITRIHKREVTRIADELVSLGFNYIGVKIEKFPLWGGSIKQLSFASEKNCAFATIYISWYMVSYYFYTPFKDGQYVLTAYNSFQDMNRKNYIIARLKSNDSQNGLELHKNNVQVFRNKGFIPYHEYSKQSRLQASDAYYQSSIARSQWRIAGAISCFGFIIFILPLIWKIIP